MALLFSVKEKEAPPSVVPPKKTRTKKPKPALVEAQVQPQAEVSPIQIVAVEAVPEVSTTPITILTQTYIELYKRYQDLHVKELVTRMEGIKKTLHEYANEHFAADKPSTFESAAGTVMFSERSKAVVVEEPLKLLEDLETKFGSEAVLSVIQIGLTPLRQILSPLELQAYTKEVPAHRTLKSVSPKE